MPVIEGNNSVIDDKPFSQACENNKHVILTYLQDCFAKAKTILEIGSGTGQHAVHFAAGLPHVQWQTSDQPQYHTGINSWIDSFPSDNLRRPLPMTIGEDSWPEEKFDGVFTANTAHIMQKSEVVTLMSLVSENLPHGGIFAQYGPFTESGLFSSESNLSFHHKLISQGYGGYRDIDELIKWAPALNLRDRIQMPANNMLLLWQKP